MNILDIPKKAGVTTAQVETALGISAQGDAAKVLNEQGDFISAGGGAEKSLLDYINDFDMTPPEHGFCFLTIDKNLNTNAIINAGNYTATVQNDGKFIIKQYKLDNTIAWSQDLYSTDVKTIVLNSSDSLLTPFGKITKYSMQPKSNSIPITAISFANEGSLLHCVFGVNAFAALTSAANMFNGCKSITYPPILPTSWSVILTVASMFSNCSNLLTPPILPTSWGSVTTTNYMFNNCNSLLTPPLLPDSWGSITIVTNMFAYCYNMVTPPILPTSWGLVNTVSSMFDDCISMVTPPILPTSWGSITTVASMFNYCYNMQTPPILPNSWGFVNTVSSMFNNCISMAGEITLPTDIGLITNIAVMFYLNYQITSISNMTQAQNIQIGADNYIVKSSLLTAISNLFKVSKIGITGAVNQLTAITSIDINYANSLFTGYSPQIDFTYNSLDATEINRILTALPTLVGKTISVTGNPGAATCTTSIATVKGWTVTTA